MYILIKILILLKLKKINYIPQEENCDVYIPKKMNDELASVCGVLICPSTEIRLNDKDKLVIVCKDRILSKIFYKIYKGYFSNKTKK